MQILRILILIMILPGIINAQDYFEGCTSHQRLKQQIKDQNQLLKFKDVQRSIHSSLLSSSVLVRTEIVIPVVFHIVWNNEFENIPDEQIYNQIDALNDAFIKSNIETQYVPPLFRDLTGNPGFRFCLANMDPEGNLHSGINRVETEHMFVGDAENLEGKPRIKYTDLGGIDAWDPDHYINVWVGRKELGYGEATFPGSTVIEEQGIIMDPRFTGIQFENVSNPDFNRGHVLIHEIGHFFNLRHLFGDEEGCGSDDGIEDTPTQEGAYSACPDHPQISCNSADMFMNFMALTNDECTRFFTRDQSEMMRATLDEARSSLKNQSCDSGNSPSTLEEQIQTKLILSQLKIQIELSVVEGDIIDLSLYDISGRLHFKDLLMNRFFYSVDVSALNPGVYILVLENEDDKLVIKFYIP